MSFAGGEPPHRAPEASPPRGPGPVFLGGMILGSLFLWSVAAFQITFVTPRFVKIFDDFKMATPLGTKVVVDHAMWIVPTAMFASFLLSALERSRWLWIILLLGVPAFVNLAIIANLYFPYMKLLEGLGGNLPKG